MGMFSKVVGYRTEDDDTYKKHAKVLIACKEAGIKILPEETAKYFQWEYPEEYLLKEVLEIEVPNKKINEDDSDIIEVKVSDIPEGVEVLRFVNK